jgi:hypothetical protein
LNERREVFQDISRELFAFTNHGIRILEEILQECKGVLNRVSKKPYNTSLTLGVEFVKK